MSRAQEIVDEITASERYAKMFEGRVFRDEPILATGRDVAARRRETRPTKATHHAAAPVAPVEPMAPMPPMAGSGKDSDSGTETRPASSANPSINSSTNPSSRPGVAADRHNRTPRPTASREAAGDGGGLASMPEASSSFLGDFDGSPLVTGPAPEAQASTMPAGATTPRVVTSPLCHD